MKTWVLQAAWPGLHATAKHSLISSVSSAGVAVTWRMVHLSTRLSTGLQAQAPSHRRQQGMKCKAGSASGLQGQPHISSFRVALQMREKPPLNKASQGLFFPLGKAFWIKKEEGTHVYVCIYVYIYTYICIHKWQRVLAVYIVIILFDFFFLWLWLHRQNKTICRFSSKTCRSGKQYSWLSTPYGHCCGLFGHPVDTIQCS